MLQQSCVLRVLVQIFVTLHFLNLFIAAHTHHNQYIKSNAAVSSVTTYGDEGSDGDIHPQETWQPIASQKNNNWFITGGSGDVVGVAAAIRIAKQTGSPESVLPPYTMPLGRTYSPHTHAQYQHLQQQVGQQQVRQKLTTTLQHPVNYYAYNQNHSTGNYRQTSAATPPPPPPRKSAATMKLTNGVKVDEPYVLAISKLPRSAPPPTPSINVIATETEAAGVGRQHSTAMNSLTRRKIPVSLFVGGSKLPQDIINKSASNTKSQTDVGQDIKSNTANGGDVKNSYDSSSGIAHWQRNNVIVLPTAGAATVVADINNVVDDNISATVDHDTQFNEILLPLESALDKVIHFCYFAKHFINEVEEKEIDEQNETIPTTGPRPDLNDSGDGTATFAGEVQGRNSAPAAVIAKSSSSLHDDYSLYSHKDFDLSRFSRGHKKKYKRQLKKLILPLLIAYKLKFLTLVPVLIGGLTLLVGATGMAGFFFALFAAVMTLKTSAGGSKSVIVKRI